MGNRTFHLLHILSIQLGQHRPNIHDFYALLGRRDSSYDHFLSIDDRNVDEPVRFNAMVVHSVSFVLRHAKPCG